MIYLTALTFLLVGYLLGLMQHNPDLPKQAYKRAKEKVNPERVGAIKRPSAEAIAKRQNPLQKAEEEAMSETLKEIL